jgi:hypothetical protein
VVADLVDARRGNQGGQLLQEFQRLEDDMGGSVAPAMLETIKQPAISKPRQALCCHRWSAGVTAEPLEAPSVPGRHSHLRMDG